MTNLQLQGCILTNLQLQGCILTNLEVQGCILEPSWILLRLASFQSPSEHLTSVVLGVLLILGCIVIQSKFVKCLPNKESDGCIQSRFLPKCLSRVSLRRRVVRIRRGPGLLLRPLLSLLKVELLLGGQLGLQEAAQPGA